MDSQTTTFLEHEEIPIGGPFSSRDVAYLQQCHPSTFKHKNGNLSTSNYVGIITTPSGSVIEILPKISLSSEEDTEFSNARQVFLKMLRRSRSLPHQASDSLIRDLRNFPMHRFFIRQFLQDLTQLAHEGLARKYVQTEDNLPYLRGRMIFHAHLRANHTNEARFYVAFSELNINRPVNRLIVSALHRLDSVVDYGENRKLLNNLKVMFADVPRSHNIVADWNTHSVDRSMRHYANVMRWIGLFLFNRGLATYAGRHSNLSLLFPMERIFEDFVSDSLKRYQNRYVTQSQRPQRPLISSDQKPMFYTKPDISLMSGTKVQFILDAKWKKVVEGNRAENFNISQQDLYQLYTYGKSYDCKVVVLIYPKSKDFTTTMQLRFFDDLKLVCYPFCVETPEQSVEELVSQLSSA